MQCAFVEAKPDAALARPDATDRPVTGSKGHLTPQVNYTKWGYPLFPSVSTKITGVRWVMEGGGGLVL